MDISSGRMSAISAINDSISSLETELKKVQDEYNSLIVFKSTVRNSESDFHSVLAIPKKKVAKLEVYKVNSLTVREYGDCMENLIGFIGQGMTGKVFKIFLGFIDVRLAFYKEKIADLQKSIKESNDALTNLLAAKE